MGTEIHIDGPHGRSISVIIPAFRSPGTLRSICSELAFHVAPLVDKMEVVFVDDGSGDGTWATIQELATELMWVRGIRLLRNYGQHNALLAGIRSARYSLVLTMDDDLQNPPSQVPLLLQAMTADVDLVYATPRTMPHGRWRNLTSVATKHAMALALGPDVNAHTSAFRLFRAELVAAGDAISDPFVSIDVLLSWATTRVVVVEVEFATRPSGQSNYTTGRLVRHAANMVTGYSSRPLRVLSVLGFACALLGFGLLAYVLIRFARGDADVAGFTFLAAAVTLFSGVQLLSLGLIGEYLGRVHFRSMGRPPFVVRDQTE